MPLSSHLAALRIHVVPGLLVPAVLLSGCDTSDLGLPGAAREAEAFFDEIPERLASGGPLAWLDLFESGPAFFMASDGAVAFEDRPAAEAFLADFASQVASIRLEWREPRIDPLTSSLVVVSSDYVEEIVTTDGETSRFGGHVTGVLRRAGGTWRIQHLHWSSPPTEEGGSRRW